MKTIYDTPITDFISRGVETVKLTDPVKLAAQRYKSSPLQILLATNDDGRLAGVITDNDLTKLLDMKPDQEVRELATTHDVVAIRPDTELWQLLKIINGENARNMPLNAIPVVDEEKRPIGVVTRDSLRRLLPKTLAET